MKSIIVQELKMAYHPVAISFTDEKPAEANQIREGKWGCVMALYTNVIKRGKPAVFDRKTYGCIGGGVGLCLGDTYAPNREFMLKLLADDEKYFKNRELTADFVDNFPFVDIPHEFVVFAPLEQIDSEVDQPALVSFPVNADQLGALTVLVNYRRPGNEHVAAPFCAGCQSVCVLPYNERKNQYPRGIIGNLDLSSRKILPKDILTFTVPFETFLEMEEDAPDCFFKTDTWEKIAARL
ncbi:MAG: DUF169 domain-containing protein [Candidatus Zixiibacteriota bacterium]